MNIKDFFKNVAHVVPLIVGIVPGIPPELVPFIVKGVSTAESFDGASGPEKLQMALDEVNNGVAALNKVKPGSVSAPDVNAAVVHGIAATISTLKAIDSTKHPLPSQPPVD